MTAYQLSKTINISAIIDQVEKKAYDLDAGFDSLLEKIGDSKIVMLGESTHGTHEYYLWRALISQKLIEEKDFNFIAVEGDWPDCYEINRHIKDYDGAPANALEAQHSFKRWPTWMWANWEMHALIEWLQRHNNKFKNRKVGFYGLDVYSLWESLESLMTYLRKNGDHEAYKTALKAFECFEPYGREGSDYGMSSRFVSKSCENEVVDLLKEVRSKVVFYDHDPESPFCAEQNASVAVNAEKYYRSMIEGGAASWNIRDEHMIQTLENLMNFHGPEAKAIVWEHNTHIGDARATPMKRSGMVNIGELAREKWGEKNTFLIGFGSYEGSVMAGTSWGSKMKSMPLPPARDNSWEEILHRVSTGNLYLFSEDLKSESEFNNSVKHRAIGVVYNPQHESLSNYVPSVIPQRYDAFMFFDRTEGLHPIGIEPELYEVPETYPWGL
jgi:erythromycin esterase-like protein